MRCRQSVAPSPNSWCHVPSKDAVCVSGGSDKCGEAEGDSQGLGEAGASRTTLVWPSGWGQRVAGGRCARGPCAPGSSRPTLKLTREGLTLQSQGRSAASLGTGDRAKCNKTPEGMGPLADIRAA